jgi:uncharacterized protein (TIGR00255 family)
MSKPATLSSMTGFARGEGGYEGSHWYWEARSVNARGLDVRFRLPSGFESLEAPARIVANERFKRGSLTLNLTVSAQGRTPRIKVNTDVLAQVVKAIHAIRFETDAAPPTADGILAIRGVLETEEVAPTEQEMSARDASVLTSLSTALDALARARAEEGRRLALVLTAQIDEIGKLTREAAGIAAMQPRAQKERLKRQVAELLEAGASISPERLAQELALLAAKADVREEIDRLVSHVAQARAMIAQGEAAGRRLDFLAQEFNREANTLCSKSADLELTRIGLAMKASIDQFREQVQNVE